MTWLAGRIRHRLEAFAGSRRTRQRSSPDATLPLDPSPRHDLFADARAAAWAEGCVLSFAPRFAAFL
jgi:hypothetical protein